MKEYFKSVLCGIFGVLVHVSVIAVGFLTTLMYKFIPQTSGWVSIFLFVCGVFFGALTLLGLWTLGQCAQGKIQFFKQKEKKTDE